MGKSKTLIILIVIFALLIVGASLLYGKLSAENEAETLGSTQTPSAESAETSAEEGEKNEDEDIVKVAAPDITVYNSDGEAVKLSDFKGKPVVINFWASWCGVCVREMPDFDEVCKELDGKVVFMMVNMTDGYQETKESAMDFLEEEGFSFPVYYDTDFDAAVKYSVATLPATYFIDAEGYAVAQAKTAINRETLERGIDMIR